MSFNELMRNKASAKRATVSNVAPNQGLQVTSLALTPVHRNGRPSSRGPVAPIESREAPIEDSSSDSDMITLESIITEKPPAKVVRMFLRENLEDCKARLYKHFEDY